MVLDIFMVNGTNCGAGKKSWDWYDLDPIKNTPLKNSGEKGLWFWL